MSTQTATVDDITKSFTFPTIPKHSGIPSYETIAATHAKLKINAASIPTTLGSGKHGHLGLVLPPTPMSLSSIPSIPESIPKSQQEPHQHRSMPSTDNTKLIQRHGKNVSTQIQP
jgi:hypothetical protein